RDCTLALPRSLCHAPPPTPPPPLSLPRRSSDLGSHLTRALAADGRVRVVALDDLSGGFRDNLPPDVAFVEGSVTDAALVARVFQDRKSTRLNSSHGSISYAVFCLKKKRKTRQPA